MIKPRQRESGGYYWVSVKILETQSFCNQPHITQASPSDIKIIYSAWFKKKIKKQHCPQRIRKAGMNLLVVITQLLLIGKSALRSVDLAIFWFSLCYKLNTVYSYFLFQQLVAYFLYCGLLCFSTSTII